MLLGTLLGSYLLLNQAEKLDASQKLQLAKDGLFKLLIQVENNNANLANIIAKDSNVVNSLDDNEKLVNVLNGYLNKYNNTGCVTVVNKDGQVLASTDTPNKSNYSIKKDSDTIKSVLTREKDFHGYTSFGPTGVIFLSSAVPIMDDENLIGAVIVSQPINDEFLSSCSTALTFMKNNPVNGIDFVAYSLRSKKIVASTTELLSAKLSLLQQLTNNTIDFNNLLKSKNLKILPNANNIYGFESDCRWWYLQPLDAGNNQNPCGYLFFTTKLNSLNDTLLVILIAAVASTILALFFSLIFTIIYTNSVNQPLKKLILHAQKLAKYGDEVPKVVGLKGDWLILAENMDTSVSSLRTTINNIKNQVVPETQIDNNPESGKQVKLISDQLASLNKQYAVQTKQISELSKLSEIANQRVNQLQQTIDTIIQQSFDAMVVIDERNSILRANQQFFQWVGLGDKDILGKSLYDFLKTTNKKTDGGFDRFEEFVIYNFSNEEYKEVVGTKVNLPPQNNQNTQLFILLDKTTQSEPVRLKGEFTSLLANSVRQSLMESQSSLDNLLNHARSNIPPVIGQNLLSVNANILNILALVDSLIMAYGGVVPTRIETRESIAITRLMSECLDQTANLARSRQLSLDLKSPIGLPPISGNSSNIKGIIVPLLEKIVNMTSPGGRIRIENTVKDKELKIALISSGPAISNEETFEFFAGFNPQKHSEESYGERLGLYLAKTNAERLGIKIFIDSGDNRGTTISIVLPIKN